MVVGGAGPGDGAGRGRGELHARAGSSVAVGRAPLNRSAGSSATPLAAIMNPHGPLHHNTAGRHRLSQTSSPPNKTEYREMSRGG